MPSFARILTLDTITKAIEGDDGARYVEGFASSQSIDRQDEVVNQKSLMRAFDRNRVVYLRDHKMERAIGYVEKADLRDGKFYSRAKIVPAGEMEIADELWSLLKIGTPVSQSIGFNPVGSWEDSGEDVDGVWTWGGEDGSKDIELLEISAVMVGANREADLHMAKGLGLRLDRPWELHRKSFKAWGALSAGDIESQLRAQLDSSRPGALSDVWIAELYEDYAIVEMGADGKHYRVSFTVLDGTVVIGDKQEVERAWVNVAMQLVGTTEQKEEQRFNEDVTAATGRLEAARNIIRHWQKSGRALSPGALDCLLSPISMIPEILRAGRVLSDQNRSAVVAAIEALQDVVKRDDASRGTPAEDAGPKAASILDAPFMPSVLDRPYRA